MAVTSFGYGVDENNTEGEIGVVQWAAMSTYMGAQYAVGDGGLSATIPATGDRRIQIAAGEGYSHGVLAISDATVNVDFAAPPSGTRYYIAGIEFDWVNRVSTIKELGYGSTIAAALATLTVQPGVKVQMPLHAARVVAGQTKVQSVTDLRVFGSGSSLSARSEEVMLFANRIGTTLQLGQYFYRRVLNPNGTVSWMSTDLLNGDISSSRLLPNWTDVSGWGSSASGWTSGATGYSSRMLRWGPWRQLILYMRRASSTPLVFNSQGNVADTTMFTIASGHRPETRQVIPLLYKHGNTSSSIGGWGVIGGGSVQVVAGLPNTQINQRSTADGWSLYLSATYLAG